MMETIYTKCPSDGTPLECRVWPAGPAGSAGSDPDDGLVAVILPEEPGVPSDPAEYFPRTCPGLARSLHGAGVSVVVPVPRGMGRSGGAALFPMCSSGGSSTPSTDLRHTLDVAVARFGLPSRFVLVGRGWSTVLVRQYAIEDSRVVGVVLLDAWPSVGRRRYVVGPDGGDEAVDIGAIHGLPCHHGALRMRGGLLRASVLAGQGQYHRAVAALDRECPALAFEIRLPEHVRAFVQVDRSLSCARYLVDEFQDTCARRPGSTLHLVGPGVEDDTSTANLVCGWIRDPLFVRPYRVEPTRHFPIPWHTPVAARCWQLSSTVELRAGYVDYGALPGVHTLSRVSSSVRDAFIRFMGMVAGTRAAGSVAGALGTAADLLWLYGSFTRWSGDTCPNWCILDPVVGYPCAAVGFPSLSLRTRRRCTGYVRVVLFVARSTREMYILGESAPVDAGSLPDGGGVVDIPFPFVHFSMQAGDHVGIVLVPGPGSRFEVSTPREPCRFEVLSICLRIPLH